MPPGRLLHHALREHAGHRPDGERVTFVGGCVDDGGASRVELAVVVDAQLEARAARGVERLHRQLRAVAGVDGQLGDAAGQPADEAHLDGGRGLASA